MTASDSLPPIDDELLSAYLDDELSAAERTVVEQRLATDAAARRLLDELRSLRTTLKQLPVERPDPGLQEAVQERIAELQPTLSAVETARRDRRGAGRFVWAGLAIAAALFLALVLPNEQPAKLAGVDRQRKPERPPGAAAGPELQLESLAADEAALAENEAFTEPAVAPPPLLDAREGRLDAAPAEEEAALALDTTRSAPAEPAGALGLGQFPPSAEMYGMAAATIPVVEVTLAARGATFDDFHRLLVNNQVDLRETDADGQAQQMVLQQQKIARAQLGQQRAGEEVDAAPEDVVLIEATPAQVEQILSEVHRDQDTFEEVAIHGAASGGYGGRYEQAPANAWRQYARGRTPGAFAARSQPDERRQNAAARQLAERQLQRQAATAAATATEGTSGDSSSQVRGWAYRLQTAKQVQTVPAGGEPPAAIPQAIARPEDDANPRIQVLFLLQNPQQQ